MYRRQVLLWLVSATATVLFGSCEHLCFVDTIPAKNLTETRMAVTYYRIQRFWNAHGKVPATPGELPEKEQKDCSMIDGWGRKLKWESDGKTKVKVWSLGRDGKLGGSGEDADLEFVFVGSRRDQDDIATIKRSDACP